MIQFQFVDPNSNGFLVLVRDHCVRVGGPTKRHSLLAGNGIFLSITNDTLRLLPPRVARKLTTTSFPESFQNLDFVTLKVIDPEVNV